MLITLCLYSPHSWVIMFGGVFGLVGVLGRLLRWVVVAIVVSAIYILALLVLLLFGFITPLLFVVLLVLGVPLIFIILAVLAVPLAILGVLIPAAILIVLLVILSLLLSVTLSVVLTVIVLWAADKAFTDVLGVGLLPLREGGSIVWWRVAIAALLFLSILSIVSRLFSTPRVRFRRETGYGRVW